MPGESPLVSCIVPVYGGEKYLSEALDSIASQTHQPIEIIVVDDGSTDASAVVAAGHPSQPRSIRQANAGPAAARNRGVNDARGEYVAFLDADDLWHPEKLTRQFHLLANRPDAGVCVTEIRNFWSPELDETERAGEPENFSRPWTAYNCVGLLTSRQVFDKVGPFDEQLRITEDLEWFARLPDLGIEVAVVPEVLVFRRVHPGNLTRRQAAESRDAFLRHVKTGLDRRRGRC